MSGMASRWIGVDMVMPFFLRALFSCSSRPSSSKLTSLSSSS
uniref:Uncharacterized protein n=1 Tax=Arundo donax TaxID=35708 RepID=A0A0A9DIC0_ARUDO